MKSNNKAIFHIIVTQLGWGLFLALNARRSLAMIFQISDPYFLLLNVFIASKGSNFYILFITTNCVKSFGEVDKRRVYIDLHSVFGFSPEAFLL